MRDLCGWRLAVARVSIVPETTPSSRGRGAKACPDTPEQPAMQHEKQTTCFFPFGKEPGLDKLVRLPETVQPCQPVAAINRSSTYTCTVMHIRCIILGFADEWVWDDRTNRHDSVQSFPSCAPIQIRPAYARRSHPPPPYQTEFPMEPSRGDSASGPDAYAQPCVLIRRSRWTRRQRTD